MVKLKSKPDAIQKMVGDAVSRLPEVAVAFYTLVSAHPSARPALLQALSDLEQEADERYVKLVRKVADTFITPYDREDLYRMMEALDDIVDALDHCGQLVLDFEMDKLPDEFQSNAKELVGMCEQARDAVGLLKKPAKLEKVLFAINAHEQALDVGYRAMLRNAFADGADRMYALKMKTLADVVEEASARIDDFTRTLAVAAIKET